MSYTYMHDCCLNFQEPFNEIANEYCKRLTAGMETMLREKCVFRSPKTKLLMEELFEYITFSLNKTVVHSPYGDIGSDFR